MVIQQGDVFWIDFAGTRSEPAGRRPAIVIQHARFNRSAISTCVMVAVTSNLKRARDPGNVELSAGEANLPKASVANVTQLATIDRQRLRERIGTLSGHRLDEILSGVALVVGLPAPQSVRIE